MAQVTASALLETALDCVDDFYARLFRDWPDAIVRSAGDCTLSYCGDPRLNGANHLFPHTPDALTPAVLDEAEAFFAAFDAVWTVIYTDRYMPRAEPLLAARRYSPRWHSPLMVADDRRDQCGAAAGSAPIRRPPQPPRPEHRVLRAHTPEHQDDILRVLRDAFGTNAAISRNVVRRAHLTDPTAGVWHYLAFSGRTPTACASVAIHACGMATVWNVGTRPYYRRQGFASAIMHVMHDDLRAAGMQQCALMSSNDGQTLYERLGYHTLAHVYYMGPPASGAWFD
jgi:ribosomal protein S18 acetylase RimI-like enzyme